MNYAKKTLLIISTLILFIACKKDDAEPEDTSSSENSEVVISATGFTVTIDENPTIYTVLGDLNASASNGAKILVSLVNSNVQGAFGTINTDEIIVSDVSKFDYEGNSQVTATYRVYELSTVNTDDENYIEVDIVVNLSDLKEVIILE